MATKEAVLIGAISGVFTFLTMTVLERFPSVDDPCASFAVHGLSGAWGLLAVGIFGRKEGEFVKHDGLIAGGKEPIL